MSICVVSILAVGDMVINLENKTGLSHKSTKLNAVPPPSMFVPCFGTYKLRRCTLIGFSSLSVTI